MIRPSISSRLFAAAAGLAALAAGAAWAGTEGMPHMPQAQEKGAYVIQNEDQGATLQDERGFGDREPMVRMMNLMMVEGSGYQGMDMSGMAMEARPAAKAPVSAPVAVLASAAATSSAKLPYRFDLTTTPTPPKVGTDLLVFRIRTPDGKPLKHLKLKAQVYSTDMDMGTDEPRVVEKAPGVYQVKAAFSMQGAWAVKLLLPAHGEQVFPLSVHR